MDKRSLVQVRLQRSLVKRIDHLSVEWDMNRTQTLERLLLRVIDAAEAEARAADAVEP